MKLDTIDIPGGWMSIVYAKQMVPHTYPWLSSHYVQEMGQGITEIKVTCTCSTLAQRDALELKCRQTGTKNLYFPSVNGNADLDDRYFIVKTSQVRWTPVTATVYQGEFDALAADPEPYETATGLHVGA